MLFSLNKGFHDLKDIGKLNYVINVRHRRLRVLG